MQLILLVKLIGHKLSNTQYKFDDKITQAIDLMKFYKLEIAQYTK